MKRRNLGDRCFVLCNTLLLLLLCFVTAYPMYYVVCASFSNNTQLIATPGVLLYPKGFGVGAYANAFKHPLIASGYRNILFILAVSLPLNLVMTWLCAYFMASKNVPLKRPILFLITFTMFFGGGLIPGFLNIRSLGLYNSLWALIIPGAMSVYNAIICRTAMSTIPESLYESAYLDGANDWIVLVRIVVPLIIPTSAVLLLYYGVGHWNSWFPASIYLKENAKLPIQNILRSILIQNADILSNSASAGTDEFQRYSESIKYAAVVITTLPAMCIYPFLQKYFVKGVMIGAVKG
ncbi:MAG TPA: carbohydrate ABC transporter permease [Clostridia bacterium]|nr:carbohydrate ABC transporter permease [Clostridia bacterium]